jgi:ADP-heptose:LPS heptosyltransferase
VAVNKQWPIERYQEVARRLQRDDGIEVVQFKYPPPHGPGKRLDRVRQIEAPSFRHALAVLKNAAVYVGPEGGLHHGSAAVGTEAVVIFGGFISPGITGYKRHANLFTGGSPCGSLDRCEHCRKAMDEIRVETVMTAARGRIDGKPIS